MFANPDNYSLAEVEAMIKLGLIDGEFFYAEEWGLPDLRWDIGIDDSTWHEFAGLAFTDEASGTSPLSLNLIVRKAFAEARATAGKGKTWSESRAAGCHDGRTVRFQKHQCALPNSFSPAAMATFKLFSSGGLGQV